MLIPFAEITKKYNMKIHGILHIGAHNCEELEAYQNYDAFGFKRFFRKTSMTDEILFSYASDKLGILPHDFIKFPFVSFC